MLDKKPNCSTTVPVSIFAPHSVKSTLEVERMGMRKKMRLRILVTGWSGGGEFLVTGDVRWQRVGVAQCCK